MGTSGEGIQGQISKHGLAGSLRVAQSGPKETRDAAEQRRAVVGTSLPVRVFVCVTKSLLFHVHFFSTVGIPSFCMEKFSRYDGDGDKGGVKETMLQSKEEQERRSNSTQDDGGWNTGRLGDGEAAREEDQGKMGPREGQIEKRKGGKMEKQSGKRGWETVAPPSPSSSSLSPSPTPPPHPPPTP